MWIERTSEWGMLKRFESQRVENAKGEKEAKDAILFLVDGKIAGSAEIVGPAGQNEAEIVFSHIVPEESRPGMAGKFAEMLGGALEEREAAIRGESRLSGEAASEILQEMRKCENAFSLYYANFEHLLEKAEKTERMRLQSAPSFRREYEEDFLFEEGHEHFKAQYLLKRIAQIVGCEPWIASNDKNMAVAGKRLGDGCLEEFPDYPLAREIKKGVGFIDAIWFKNGFPACAFEVECTTAVYSGILRMADLVSVIPSTAARLYIVAPQEREEKVMRELRRPMFRRLGLSECCKFISIESLANLYQKIKGLDGYVKPEVVETIAASSEQEEYIGSEAPF